MKPARKTWVVMCFNNGGDRWSPNIDTRYESYNAANKAAYDMAKLNVARRYYIMEAIACFDHPVTVVPQLKVLY